MKITTESGKVFYTESITDSERTAYLRQLAAHYRLTRNDVSRYTGYSANYVAAWFATEGTPRHRPVPVRAVDRLILEIQAGNVQSSKGR
jgi:hypothetical protein